MSVTDNPMHIAVGVKCIAAAHRYITAKLFVCDRVVLVQHGEDCGLDQGHGWPVAELACNCKTVVGSTSQVFKVCEIEALLRLMRFYECPENTGIDAEIKWPGGKRLEHGPKFFKALTYYSGPLRSVVYYTTTIKRTDHDLT